MNIKLVKILLLFILLILLHMPLTAQINTYNYELIKVVKKELSYSTMCMPAGPGTFTISKDNLIYVIDSLRHRIVLFDLELNYIKEITSYFTKLKRDIYFANTLRIDNFGNLILTDKKNGLLKINKEGEEIFFIEKDKLPESVLYHRNFYLVDEDILFYDKNTIKSINNKGDIIDEIKTKEIIEKAKNNKNNRMIEDETISAIATYTDENNLLYLDEKILLNDFYKYKKLNEKIKQNKNKKSAKTAEIEINWADMDSTMHIGFDNDKNNYWLSSLRSKQLKWIILVFSKQGNLIDCFYSICAFASVTPNGDVYMMDSVNALNDPNYQGVTFYKITRQW